jgi:hypothetical protein
MLRFRMRQQICIWIMLDRCVNRSDLETGELQAASCVVNTATSTRDFGRRSEAAVFAVTYL